ncbi:hypothetical protein BY458DRAFT_535107 [Sporodiniella umbellata]|nr:hypothetical protein BY458DRAFT_535107 [Sporodiniella umbellata]
MFIFDLASPIWLKDIQASLPTKNKNIQTGLDDFSLPLKDYPEPDQLPPVNHPEIEYVMQQLNLKQIPDIQPRTVKGWDLVTANYDSVNDPDCWWSATICKKPKLSYLPPDVYQCPQKGDWGLNYDDGPYKSWWPETESDKAYDEPRLYNFLAKHGKQKATLFFVGSNVLRFPSAAVRALNDGHILCSHTWSHPQMTTLTNQEIVAQLYWTQKVIKEVTGITPKCWRPPYGDVDDRVRAIAWQMGMRTILWDQDSFDWNLATGLATEKSIDGHFKDWINARKNGTDNKHGHITLQHENSNQTVLLSEKWLPKIQKVFRVMPIHQCISDPHPYWENDWVYPTLKEPETHKVVDKIVKVVDTAPKDIGETVIASQALSRSSAINLIILCITSIVALLII